MTRPQWARVRRDGSDSVAFFWSQVSKSEGCWLWTGPVRSTGYGNCYIAKGWPPYPHRIAYELAVGEIPAGYTIDHLCFVKLCVRPAHLEAVTQAENTRRGTLNYNGATVDRCKRGHDRTGANVRISNSRGRISRLCRTCCLESQRRRYDLSKQRARRAKAKAARLAVAA